MKIAVLISGGVDSSVALKLLKDQGHDVTAFYIKIWLEDELSFLGSCPWQEDLSFVSKVCEKLKVPLNVISLQREYWDQVVKYTINEIKLGRTPNPDVLCNSRIKFGVFYENIGSTFEKIATGHYAQIKIENGKANLIMSPDKIKDQTYFLAHLTQEQISRCIFPIGKFQKNEVRELANKFELPNKDRKDSQGICFLGKIKFKDFIKAHLGIMPGDIIEYETNKVLSKHDGYWFYTIGQRQGIGLAGGPWFVVSKDIKNNIIYISKNYYSDEKIRNKFKVTSLNWINGKQPNFENLQIKLRHGASKYNCSVDSSDNQSLTITINQNDQGIAAGQFAVFYDNEICLGSGIIEN